MESSVQKGKDSTFTILYFLLFDQIGLRKVSLGGQRVTINETHRSLEFDTIWDHLRLCPTLHSTYIYYECVVYFAL